MLAGTGMQEWVECPKRRQAVMLRSETPRYWEFEMAEYIFLMHDDAISNDDAWGPYIERLQQADSSKAVAP
jgi:hypothetical protein